MKTKYFNDYLAKRLNKKEIAQIKAHALPCIVEPLG